MLRSIWTVAWKSMALATPISIVGSLVFSWAVPQPLSFLFSFVWGFAAGTVSALYFLGREL